MTLKIVRHLHQLVRTVFGAALLCILTLSAMAQEPMPPAEPEFITYKQTQTAKGKPVELRLHIFKPEGWSADDQRPAIVFFFGGGWTGGNPNQFYAHSRDLAALGMVAISAEYRVKSRHGTTPLACVEDGKSAVRYLRANAKQLGIDPNRIVAGGGSAGGHVAACTGVITEFDSKDEDTSVSSVPNLMVLFNPVIDTSPKNGYGAKKVPGDDPLIISPLHHAHKNQPPSIVFHGDADTTVKIGSVRAFEKKSNEIGAACTLVEYEGAGHGFFNHAKSKAAKKNSTNYYELTMGEAVTFLAKHGFVSTPSD